MDGIEVILVWEETPCPLCRHSNEEVVLETTAPTGGQSYRVVRCRRCRMCYLNPRPNRDTIGTLSELEDGEEDQLLELTEVAHVAAVLKSIQPWDCTTV